MPVKNANVKCMCSQMNDYAIGKHTIDDRTATRQASDDTIILYLVRVYLKEQTGGMNARNLRSTQPAGFMYTAKKGREKLPDKSRLHFFSTSYISTRKGQQAPSHC